jgi:choline dehydrogenase-like flavoprotein
MTAEERSVDVVVVGSGAGGGVLAKELGESGLSVVVLEAGPRFDPSKDYPTHRHDFEVTARDVFGTADPLRDRYTTTGAPFTYSRVKGVGGSTLHYAGVSPRLHESDFFVHGRDGVATDWPIRYEDLEPYYTRVERELGVSGPDGDESNPFDPPRSSRFPTPPHPFNLAGQTIKRGADKLGLHFVREPVAIPTLDWQGRRACVGAGTCMLGCQISAKSSIDVTYVSKAEATGRVEIRTGCMAREVTVSGDGKVRGVVYLDAKGVEQEVRARVIVLACNAVETPRLLLLSKSQLFPHGLANSSGLVGKYFTEHLAVYTRALFSDRVDPWRGIPTGGMIQDFYETNPQNDFARGFSLLLSSGQQWPLSVARSVGGWGKAHKKRMKESFAHIAALASVGEQLPDVGNEVRLDPFMKDSYGLPVPLLHTRLSENDRAMIRRIMTCQREILEAAGAREILEQSCEAGTSSHYMGTCRMGRDPRSSVVDAWGRAHDVPNLFIADSSVLPTVGAVNPALTISALATRTAEAIIAALERRDL